jgi:peptide/nickel transport system substrate-binding protein
LIGSGTAGIAHAQTPKRGGTLNYVVPAEPPGYDGHREGTFAMLQPLRPYYSVLIRVDPNNPSSTTDFVCDVCVGKVPEPTDDGKTYTFKIRDDVKFHTGETMTADDVVASFNKIIFPPKGVRSLRRGMFNMVESVTNPDKNTVVFKLKYATNAFVPVLAIPFNWIYQKKILDKDIHWYETNIGGSGPFIFKERQAGAFMRGDRNPDYYHKGQPYLDGIKAIFAKKESLRVQAIRGGRADIEFRGFPPASRDDLVKALGKDITVQEHTWNCPVMFSPNHKHKPFDDARVRRALSLAVDRWGGSKYLSKIAIVKTVGGITFPGHALSPTNEELQQIAGWWPDIKKSRAEARRLLKESGADLSKTYKFLVRGVDQPYKIIATWLIDQWKQIGIKFKMETHPTGPFYAIQRGTHEYDVSTDASCNTIINPLVDMTKYLSDDRASNNYYQYKDREVDALYDKMQRLTDIKAQRKIMLEITKLTLDTHANQFPILWWHRIIAHRSYVKGWKIGPSHYLNQALDNVWLDK